MITILTFVEDNNMARKSKYNRQICFIDDKYLMGQFDKTPYVCIFKCYTDPDDSNTKIIEGIDMDGKKFDRFYSNNFVYKYIEIVANKQLGEDFIKSVFER